MKIIFVGMKFIENIYLKKVFLDELVVDKTNVFINVGGRGAEGSPQNDLNSM